jgi:hypothetical protein
MRCDCGQHPTKDDLWLALQRCLECQIGWPQLVSDNSSPLCGVDRRLVRLTHRLPAVGAIAYLDGRPGLGDVFELFKQMCSNTLGLMFKLLLSLLRVACG